jgi:hypothetical protein
MTVDGIVHEGKAIKLANDLSEHFVELIFVPEESVVTS